MQINFRLLLPVVIGIIAAVLLAVFLMRPDIIPKQTSTGTPQKPMKVARYYWPGNYWVDIAANKGWFEEEGLKVEFVDTNSDYYASLEDVANKKLDVQNFWLYDVMLYRTQGVPLTMVIHNDTSIGSEAIVAQKSILGVQDLTNKKIGVEQNTALDYIINTVLRQNKIVQNDVNIVNGSTEQLAKQFVNGEVDAVVTWEPYITEALQREGSHKIWTSEDIPGIVSAGYTFHNDFIEERPEDVQKFVNVWYKTTEYIKENPNEAYAIVAEAYNRPVEEVKSFTKVNKIEDFEQNRISFSYAATLQSLHGQAKQISNYFVQQGVTDRYMDSPQFINNKFIFTIEEQLFKNKKL